MSGEHSKTAVVCDPWKRAKSQLRSWSAIQLIYYLLNTALIKATSWSTNDNITDAHISATIQQILTKFSAVVTYVN